MAKVQKSALFVCLGNICRSPIAESAMNFIVKEAGEASQWRIDSASTANYHPGESPDERAVSVINKHGLTTNHHARQLRHADFEEFDYIFGMDQDNIRAIKRAAPSGSYKAKIELLGDYNPGGPIIIEDPYYESGKKGFEVNYEQCMKCCKGFFDKSYK